MDDYERKLLEEIRNDINVIAWNKLGFRANDSIEKILRITEQRLEGSVNYALSEISSRGYEVDGNLSLLLQELPLTFKARREQGKKDREIIKELTEIIKQENCRPKI